MDNLNQIGVLLTGFVEKQNPSRFGTLKRKFLVLTHIGIHWFKRNPGEDLFGEERGCIKLVDISIVKRTDEKTAKDEFQRMFEVNCVDGTQRIFLTETESQCDQWVLAIEQAMSNKFKSSSFTQQISSSMGSLTNQNDVDNEASNQGSSELDELKKIADSDPIIHLVTIAQSTKDGREMVISRHNAWGDKLTIRGDWMCADDAMLITLSGGGIARIGKSKRSDANKLKGQRLSTSLEVYGGGLVKSIDIELSVSSNYGRLVKSPRILLPICASVVCVLLALYAIISMLFYDFPPKTMLIVALANLWLASAMLPEALNGAVAAAKTWELQFLKSNSLPPYSLATSTTNSESEIPQRYLTACGGSVADAYLSWSNTLRFRSSWAVDSFLSTKPTGTSKSGGWASSSPWYKIAQNLTHLKTKRLLSFTAGVDPWARPCFYVRPATLDLTSSTPSSSSSFVREDLQKLLVMMLEFMISRQEHNQESGKSILILDLRDISLKHCLDDTFEFWRSTVRLCQDHYPERCEACVVINSPPVFSFLFKMARAFVNPVTLKKVIVVPSDAAPGSWFQEHLLPEDTTDSTVADIAKLEASDWWKQLLNVYCNQDGTETRHYSETAPSPGYEGSDPTSLFAEEASFKNFVLERC